MEQEFKDVIFKDNTILSVSDYQHGEKLIEKEGKDRNNIVAVAAITTVSDDVSNEEYHVKLKYAVPTDISITSYLPSEEEVSKPETLRP